ncbi:hypothetical protein FRACYDRAFT_245924 [Fragilariopsis cylindrus CCMP1102]|uniref:Uncharacterized protein n=1 Tax=Fragilariopsis cylindrus CCMP1102 TaxID=635003 RepID=A0A1E7EZH9_9STRA|nr:hypothetical protein FRACYDRAFT_245924 [Fragilariopsis cylindrus CCMP1102]|eukprot:OEU11408.1 hypothetical protein FRACYDRAFT_245924 [Fragilariopsis cylindrus CCMP1102]
MRKAANSNENTNDHNKNSKLPLSPKSSSHQRRSVMGTTTMAAAAATTEGSAHRTSTDSDDNQFGIDDLSIQLSETARLERMMNKFDLLTSSNSNDDVVKEPEVTPRALNDMIEKFDSFQQSSPTTKVKNDNDNEDSGSFFRVVVREAVARDNDDVDDQEGEGIEITTTLSDTLNSNNNSPTSTSSTNIGSSSSSTMGVDLEQFRIGSSHTHDTIGCDGIGSGSGGLSRTNMSPSSPMSSSSKTNNNTTTLLEEHIVTLMSQVSSLQTKNDVLHSQLRVQHTEDVQDMYHDPFSSPSKNGRGGITLSNSALAGFNTKSTFLSKIDDAASTAVAGTGTTVIASTLPVFDSNSDLYHKELIELRMRNQSLQNEFDLSKQTQSRLKLNLISIEKQDKQKFDSLQILSEELKDSTKREKSLKDELDSCRVRLEGYEMVFGSDNDISSSGSDNSSGEGSGEEGEKKKNKMKNKKKKRKKKKNKNLSSSSSSFVTKSTSSMTNDVATALVVSTKQNDALVAHNTELELQNKKLNKQCNDLETKYGLIEPIGPDATNSAKQLYTRYIEMKSSLSSVAVELEEVQEQNSKLNKRIIQLETELKIAKDDDDDSNNNKGNNNTQNDADDDYEQQQQRLYDNDISNLTVLMEEVQEQNTVLNERIVQLEKELNDAQTQQQQQLDEEQQNDKTSSLDPITGAAGATYAISADRPVCSPRIVAPSFDEAIPRTISKEQEETLKMLVNDLKVQITDYRDMEQRHEVVRVEFESSIDNLVEENTVLKKALDVKLQQQSVTLSSTTTDGDGDGDGDVDVDVDVDVDAPVDERQEVKEQKQQLEHELEQLRNELQNSNETF